MIHLDCDWQQDHHDEAVSSSKANIARAPRSQTTWPLVTTWRNMRVGRRRGQVTGVRLGDVLSPSRRGWQTRDSIPWRDSPYQCADWKVQQFSHLSARTFWVSIVPYELTRIFEGAISHEGIPASRLLISKGHDARSRNYSNPSQTAERIEGDRRPRDLSTPKAGVAPRLRHLVWRGPFEVASRDEESGGSRAYFVSQQRNVDDIAWKRRLFSSA